MIDSTIGDETVLALSRYLVTVEISDNMIFCGHAVFGRRRLLDRRMLSLLGVFRPPQTPVAAVNEFLRLNPRLAETEEMPARLRRIIQDFAADGLLVPGGSD